MKNIAYTFLLSFLLLAMDGCKEGFGTWKQLNERWIEEKRSTLGTGDPDIKETRILPSGVMIEVFHNGFGPIPKPTVDPSTEMSSTVVVTYRGYLVDGTKFNDAANYSMQLSDAISGWREALSQMRQGSSWRIYIPYSEGYDKDGSQDAYGNFVVPPYSTLIFDIDLIDVTNY
ncbi:MAG: FKBP-type peptidyl-prolyl cis-trans isomerase [Candidatus Aphodosoma sp.]